MSTVIDIADAVVEALNAASLGQTFTAVRAYNHRINKEDLSDVNPTVAVVPAEIPTDIMDRGGATDKRYGIDIGIQRKLTRAEATSRVSINAAFDPLMTFVEAVIALFLGKQIGDTDSTCVASDNEPIFSREALQDNEFLSIVSLTIKKVA